jgi:cell cycle sensor histidine kinase DivJ
LSAVTTRPGNWLTGMAAGCERLVHPAVTGGERKRQRRLLAALLSGPFVAAAAIVQTVMPHYGAATGLAVLCAVFSASWLVAYLVGTSGRRDRAEPVALAAGALLAGALVALAGGLAGPLAILLVALPMETYWISRSRKAALQAGGLALAAAVGGGFLLDGAPSGAPDWLWLTPTLYAATLGLRWLQQTEAVSDARERNAEGLPEACFDALVVRIARNGEVESASAQATAIMGLEPELLLATGLFDRVHVADRVAFMCAVAQARDEGKAARCTVRLRMPRIPGAEGGGYRAFDIEVVRPATDGSVVALIRDGQEAATLRDELARALEQANATEIAKGRFLAAVSHELRTPLNAIIGFSDMLLHREISGEMTGKQKEHVTLIGEAGNHLLSVVNAILDVSKIEAGSYQINVEPFDLGPALEMCRAMLEPQATAKGVNLSARLPLGLGEVAGDQRAVQQILLNLLSNAIKFTPEGGNVTVNAVRSDDTIRIFVNDTGIGISAEDLATLGRPFMQVQNDYTRQFQGTGLGLSLVKGLVELHHGSMSIESAPGLGTTVTIGLPAASSGETGGRVAKLETRGEKGERHGIALRKTA